MSTVSLWKRVGINTLTGIRGVEYESTIYVRGYGDSDRVCRFIRIDSLMDNYCNNNRWTQRLGVLHVRFTTIKQSK